MAKLGRFFRHIDMPLLELRYRAGAVLTALAAFLVVGSLLFGNDIVRPAAAESGGFKREVLVIRTSGGEVSFDVELALTVEQQSRGLMFRRSLGEKQGMLFIYENEDVIQMWMQNTYIPLDMIFIRGDGTVHRIARHTEPFSKRLISSGAPVSGVLEVNAGIAEKFGIKRGDKVLHARFNQN